MAAFDDSAWLGARKIRFAETSLQTITDYSRGTMGGVDLSFAFRNNGFFILPLSIAAAINDATVTGIAQVAAVPFKVVGAHIGCESAAGTSANGKIEVDRAADGTWADLVEADVDISSDAKTMQPAEITDGEEDVEAGQELRLSITGVGAGAVVGAIAHLFCFRL